MMPAMMPAASWFDGELRTFVRPALDREGQRQRTVLQRVREALGLAPRSKLPVISARPPVIGWSLDGSDSTLPSSTIASRCWSPMLVFWLTGDLAS